MIRESSNEELIELRNVSYGMANELGATWPGVTNVTETEVHIRWRRSNTRKDSKARHLGLSGFHKECTLATMLVFFAVLVGSPKAFAQVDAFSPTGSLNTGRNGHRAIALNDGRVLITGGYDANENALASSEIYDPTSGKFTPTGSLNTARRNFGMTLLDNGMVLVTGGYDAAFHALASAEIYDPNSGIFSPTGALSTARADQTATRLYNGTVLIAGGFDANGNPLSSAEIYVPATGTFAATGSLNTARGFSTATALLDGTVLIAGGWDSGGALASAETYDPVSRAFTPTGSMNAARVRNTATLLNGGKVLVVGGEDSASSILGSAEIYNPANRGFAGTGSLNTARGDHAATLLTNGLVLVEGGFACNPANCLATDVDMSASAELYDPVTQTFSVTGGLGTARQVHTATLLTNGTVLVSGGWSNNNPGLTSAEVYQPSTLAPSGLVSITISPASPSLLVGTAQALVATGTFSDSSTQALPSVAWKSSDRTVAVVSNDSGSNSGILNDSTNSGVVFGIGTGTATVSACAGATCGSTTVAIISPGAGPSFALLGSPQSQTIPAGATATFSLRLMSIAGFSGDVTLFCTGAPVGSTCMVSPAILKAQETNAATMTIETSASLGVLSTSELATTPRAPKKSLELVAIGTLFPVTLGFCLLAPPTMGKLWRATLVGILLFAMSGCGGPGLRSVSETRSGRYVVVVTGTSGGISNSTRFVLVVR